MLISVGKVIGWNYKEEAIYEMNKEKKNQKRQKLDLDIISSSANMNKKKKQRCGYLNMKKMKRLNICFSGETNRNQNRS